MTSSRIEGTLPDHFEEGFRAKYGDLGGRKVTEETDSNRGTVKKVLGVAVVVLVSGTLLATGIGGLVAGAVGAGIAFGAGTVLTCGTAAVESSV